MTLAERIVQHLKSLPQPEQNKVLDFIRHLEDQVRRESGSRENFDWEEFSLSQAMRDLEDESSTYAMDDLREVFS